MKFVEILPRTRLFVDFPSSSWLKTVLFLFFTFQVDQRINLGAQNSFGVPTKLFSSGLSLVENTTEQYSFELVADKSYIPCYTEITCPTETKVSTAEGNFFPSKDELYYQSKVSYHCGRGRAFISEVGEKTIEVQNFTCEWDKSWQPSDKLMDCTCKQKFV